MNCVHMHSSLFMAGHAVVRRFMYALFALHLGGLVLHLWLSRRHVNALDGGRANRAVLRVPRDGRTGHAWLSDVLVTARRVYCVELPLVRPLAFFSTRALEGGGRNQVWVKMTSSGFGWDDVICV